MVSQAEQLLSLFEMMLYIRRVEEKIADAYKEQQMRCPVHLCIGQEAIAVGISHALRRDDMVFSMHRSHGHYLAKGGDLKRLIAELHGKVTGCCQGKGGSMHLIDVDCGFMGSTSIVSGTIPLAVGAAMGVQMKGGNNITVAFFGDAAVEEGVFYESINFAALQKLPVIFVCENNLYSVYTPLSLRQSEREIHAMVSGHGLHSLCADGNDVVSVYENALHAVELTRKGCGPIFLELKTYRWREHCGPNYDNDLGYRSQEEFEHWRERCPLAGMQQRLVTGNLLDQDMLADMKKNIDFKINEAFDFARQSPFPSQEDLFRNIYAEENV